MIASLALAAALMTQTAPAAAAQDGPVATAAPASGETADALRIREAVAYANPLPRGAPEQDYPLVAWCEALVNGHVAIGETLTDADPLDRDIVRLGKLEAADFRAALNAAAPRQQRRKRARSSCRALFSSAPNRRRSGWPRTGTSGVFPRRR